MNSGDDYDDEINFSSSDNQPKIVEEKKKSFNFKDPKFFPPISTTSIHRNLYSRFIVYSIQRTKEIKISGVRYHYQLYFEGNPLFHTKTKIKKPEDPIKISKGSEMHFSQEKFEAVLLRSEKNHLFSLWT